MLKLEPIEFFLRALPEGLLLILAIYSFSKIRIDIKKYIISSLTCSVAIFLVRMLPISYGVHTILGMGIAMVLGVSINKIDVIKTIKGILIYVIIQLILEGVNVFIIQNVLKGDMNIIFTDPIKKTLYGLPSIGILAIIAIGYYIINYKKGELIDV